MIEWLLKEENEKAKVGRPELAKRQTIKKAEYSILGCILLMFILMFSFLSTMNNKSPFEYAYLLTKNKLFASSAFQNKNGFLVTNSYEKNEYVLKIDIPSSVSRYSGSYKYTVYKLDKDKWKEYDTKTLDKNTKSFLIKIKRSRNENKTYKVKLELVNASKVEDSFAPFGWEFVESGKDNQKYTFKIFTVEGYYSPVTNDEIKEIKKNKDKVSINTDPLNPRKFIIDTKGKKFNVLISYTDQTGKEVDLKKDKDLTKAYEFEIPSIKRYSNVTIKIWLVDVQYSEISKLKLSSFESEKDKEGKYYIYKKYVLKPSGSYK